MRLFCCGITSNETEKISDLIESTKIYFDGYVWCVDSAENSNETYDLLDKNKKDGLIVRHKWTNSHDFQANEWLMSGAIKNNDWCYIADSSEKPSEYWMKRMKSDILDYESKGIQAVFCSGRPFLFKWTEYLFFLFTPHWSLQNIFGGIVTIPESEKYLYIINKRELNPAKHYQEHDSKYYINYSRSNQIEAFYGKFGQNVVNHHENARKEFRRYIRDALNLEPSLYALDILFKQRSWTDYEISMMELEFCLSEYFQRTVLNMDFMTEIVPRRYQFSFKNWFEGNSGFPPNYESVINKYKRIYNIKD